MSTKNQPYVWQMVREAVEALGGQTTNVAVRDWILERYPGTNKNTIQCQIIVCTVNHSSRIHYPENQKPRQATAKYDFLYRPATGQLEFYDPEKHGMWEIYERDDGRLDVRLVGSPEPEEERATGFAAEAHLRDYLAQHLDLIEEGLELFVDDHENTGVEYNTPVGRIDILAQDSTGALVAIELKVSRGPDSAAGQVLRYKNWVKMNLAEQGRVRGIIIAQHVSEKLRYAIAADPEVSAMEYELALTLKPAQRIEGNKTDAAN